MDRGGFVQASETAVVALTVPGNVQRVLLLQLGDLFLDGIPTRALGAGLDCGIVAVATSAIPVAWKGGLGQGIQGLSKALKNRTLL